jgi:VanZ family protein
MFLRYNWPALCWAIIIMVLCGIPGNQIPELTFLQWLKPDKIVHLILFGVFSYLLLRGFNLQKSYSSINKNAVALALFISIAYGALVEVLQSTLFIHRTGDVRDAIANALGAFIGYWLYKKYSFKINKPAA